MKNSTFRTCLYVCICGLSLTAASNTVAQGWSVVPYVGLSALQDQSPDIVNFDTGVDGRSDIYVENGFTAGLSLRYQYPDTRWSSEFGWEYRSNDSTITGADGTQLPDGNYASNVFYLNGRYQLLSKGQITPWLGGGLLWTQEIDLDSETDTAERSFSDSGSVGFQIMAGADYNLSERLYLTGELRYSNQTGIDLSEEGGSASVLDIDYQPITVSVGVGYRF